MEPNRKMFSGPGSYATGDENSVFSPNKSNYSGQVYNGTPPPVYPAFGKTDQFDQNNHYFPNIVLDLLSGKEEWRNIQDIIKLTLKALCDVIKDQGKAISDLENSLISKASKSELHSILTTKANVTDVSKAITEVATIIEDKASLEELNVMMEDKMSKSELQYLLTNKVSIEELRTLLEAKCNTHEINQKLQSMDSKIELCLDDIKSKCRGFALQKDLSHVMVQLDLKADLNDVNESLSGKANKTTVANALHRKANKSEVDEQIVSKVSKQELAEILEDFKKDVQNSCFNIANKSNEKSAKIDHIKELEDIILRKADKVEIDMYLSAVNTQKKDFDRRILCIERDTADVLKTVQHEIESIRTSCIETLNRKADYTEFERISEELHRKLGSEAVINLLNQAKSDIYLSIGDLKEEFIQSRKKYEDTVFERASRAEYNTGKISEEIEKIKRNIESLENTRRSIEEDTVAYSKSMYESSRKEMKHELSRLDNEIGVLRNECVNYSNNSVSNDEFEKYKRELEEVIKEKVDVDEVQRAITGCQNDAINRITSCRKSIAESCDTLAESINQIMSQKADLQDVDKKLNFFVTKEAHNVLMRTKVDLPDFESISDQIKDLYEIVDQKMSHNEFLNERDKINLIIESMEKDITNKINLIDANEIFNQKCNIDDVNKALTEVHNELDIKANHEEIENHIKSQTEINQALCAENCVARWIWKSGDLKNGFAVPWEVECINTCPENFLWEQDKSNIMTVAPGLYEIMFGFFSKKKPTVQLLVNGEPCLSAINSASYVIHHSSGKLKSTGKHKEGNIAGLTLIDFIALPARARISISFSGESAAEGFLGLRKL